MDSERKPTSIEDWVIHPNMAIKIVAFSIATGLIGFFSPELGIDSCFRHLLLSFSLTAALVFALPSLKIWQKVTEE